mmetsp:Transcript_6498/g.3681  ORF Transcript_6498/g.3681 Transcript_6498/m.3681 type:complete len:169 (+) Transcript_6498:1118-1624(+)
MYSHNPCYAYIDAKSQDMLVSRGYVEQGEDAIAYLESETIDKDIYYVEFSYHMHGKDIGSLALEYFDGNSWKQVWIKQGNQGRKWKRAAINLLPYNTKKIRFVGRSFYGKPEGNIAIDSIRITKNTGNVPRYLKDDYYINVGSFSFDPLSEGQPVIPDELRYDLASHR